MAYTEGTVTYTANEDLQKHRVVRVVASSTTDPIGVTLASTTTTDCIGITETSAKAGELVSVRPFDDNGTYQIQSAGAIAKGSLVYIGDGDGRINDEEKAMVIGRALSDGATGQLVTVAMLHQEDTEVAAEDVTVEDAGDYFTGTNVEDVLQEVGEFEDNLTASQVAIVDSAGLYTATDVEGALEEIADAAAGYKAVEDFFTMDMAMQATGGGNPATAAGRLIGSTSSNDLFRELYGTGYYGMSRVSLSSVVTGASRTTYMYLPMQLRYRAEHVQPLPLTVELLHDGNYTFAPGGSLSIQGRTMLIGSNYVLEDTYASKTVPPVATKTYATMAQFDLDTVAQPIDYVHLFLRFDYQDMQTDPLKMYGCRVQYYTKPITQL